MSRRPRTEQEESEDMTVSYSNVPSNARPQLPSLSELLPEHVQTDIEQNASISRAGYIPRSSHYSTLSHETMSKPGSAIGADYSRPQPPRVDSFDALRLQGNRSLPQLEFGQSPLKRQASDSVTSSATLPPTSRFESSQPLPPIVPAYPDGASRINPQSGYPPNYHDSSDRRVAPFDLRGPHIARSPSQALHGRTPPIPAEPLTIHRPLYGNSHYASYAPAYQSEPAYSPSTHPHQSGFGVGDVPERGKRRRGNLPKAVTDILRQWFHEHLDHPYPTEEDKQRFINQTGLTIGQISNWFINARRRQLPALRTQASRTSETERTGQRHSSLSDNEKSPN